MQNLKENTVACCLFPPVPGLLCYLLLLVLLVFLRLGALHNASGKSNALCPLVPLWQESKCYQNASGVREAAGNVGVCPKVGNEPLPWQRHLWEVGQVGAGSTDNFAITHSSGKEKFPGRATKEMQRSIRSSKREQGPESERTGELQTLLTNLLRVPDNSSDTHYSCYVSQGQDATAAKQKALPFPGELKI